ncbi:hypothetical protein Acsp04_51210 [Actinomadura sp. NBRC 104425]|nr:hypothetical protein Acsp04_51210 [Actinomadura sp. NBRC 104425]
MAFSACSQTALGGPARLKGLAGAGERLSGGMRGSLHGGAVRLLSAVHAPGPTPGQPVGSGRTGGAATVVAIGSRVAGRLR